MAVLRRPLEPGRYTSIAFGNRCREAGVRPSMGSVGDAYDNALCESFFATLECELIERTEMPTPAAAERAIFDYIEGWYNPRRRHSSLGYLSPAVFERAAAVAGNGAVGEPAPAVAESSSAGPGPLPRCAGEASDSLEVGEGGST